jgi:hypothetical protein
MALFTIYKINNGYALAESGEDVGERLSAESGGGLERESPSRVRA